MDYLEVEAKRFLRLALRLTGYEGVLTARLTQEQENGGERKTSTNYERKKLYKEANVQTTEVVATGEDYLAKKLASGPTL